MALSIVKTGTWLYAMEVETPVDIIALDYDWDYAFDSSDGLTTEPSPMGPDGVLYYARFQHALETSEPTWPDSPGYPTIAEAMAKAESKVKGGIRWHE